ncbi:MAG: hypothetical protein NVSMB25_17360 [Thermoleophilaceae bacterium]
MNETQQPTTDNDPELPHEESLDLEGPNESAPGHHPDDADRESDDE